jgi:hypothetical protein
MTDETFREIVKASAALSTQLTELLHIEPIIPFDCHWAIEQEMPLRAWAIWHYPPDDVEILTRDESQAYVVYLTYRVLRDSTPKDISNAINQWHRRFHEDGPQVLAPLSELTV